MGSEALQTLQLDRITLYEPDLWQNRERLYGCVSEASALIVRNLTRVDAALLASAPRLRVVGRLGTGLDNIDLAAAEQKGVTVVYAPGANAVAAAEFTLALCLALARQLYPAAQAARRGFWDRAALAGRELAGKTLGILGFGRIGRLVALRARAFGMEVWTYHPRLAPDDPRLRALGVRLSPFEGILRGAEFVSLHLPLTPSTHHTISTAQLALMRPDAFLINTARGGLVDETALGRALREGWIAGAALDVREVEPPPTPDPLAALDNVLLTPHLAGLSREALRLTEEAVVQDVLRVLQGQRPRLAATSHQPDGVPPPP